jgi:hypothetical protein
VITLPYWLLLLIVLVTVLLTGWLTVNHTMWMTGRMDAYDQGHDKDDFPWNWRIMLGAGAYFDWLTKKARKEGRIT